MRAAWLTDIHLNFLNPVGMEKFLSLVRRTAADAIFITGDIGDAPRLKWYLKRLETYLERPIYFVLGNHDFYLSSMAEVRAAVRTLTSDSRWLRWMTAAGVVELTPEVGLIGHDSWADGRCGDYARSKVMLNDYLAIRELRHLSKEDRLRALQHLGDEAAAYFREWLPKALVRYPQVFLLTHVPPFREACWHQGQISDDNFLPHFACKAVGEALVEMMRAHPQRQLKVLCGHTHSGGQAQILDNLLVLTGQAEYGAPQVQRLFEIE